MPFGPAQALITRCPGCGTAFRAGVDQLAMRAGLVRCSRCNEVFDAREHAVATPAEGKLHNGSSAAWQQRPMHEAPREFPLDTAHTDASSLPAEPEYGASLVDNLLATPEEGGAGIDTSWRDRDSRVETPHGDNFTDRPDFPPDPSGSIAQESISEVEKQGDGDLLYDDALQEQASSTNPDHSDDRDQPEQATSRSPEALDELESVEERPVDLVEDANGEYRKYREYGNESIAPEATIGAPAADSPYQSEKRHAQPALQEPAPIDGRAVDHLPMVQPGDHLPHHEESGVPG